MEIAVKKFSNAMCLKVPQPYENAVMRVVDGRINKKWNCIVARWSSVNCLKLAKSAQKLGWTVKPDEHFLEAIGPLSNRLEMPGFMTYQEIRQKSLASFQNVQDSVMKTRLWNHQKEAFVELHGLTGAILDMGMGTGKTATSISLIMAGKHDFGIIICPKSVVPVWPMELEKHCAKKIMAYTGPKRKTSTIKQFTKDLIDKKEIAEALGEPFFLITNYEKMWQRELGEYLLGLKDIDFVVYDECHRLKTPSGSASKMAAKLRNNARRVLGCTGTLLPHSPMDAFGIFRAVDPAVFGTINMLFRNEYAVIGGFEGKQIVGFKNQDKMHDMIQTISYRVKSEDVLDLPPFQHIVRHCELGIKTRKLYNEMHDDLCVEHEGHTLTAANALVKILRLQQITSGISTDMYGEEIMLCKDGDLPEKATLLADVLDDFAENEPLVVFCRFTADIAAVRKVAERQGRQYFELSGKKNELAEWQDNKQGILAVQIRAGKEGVDFTISCTQIYYSIGHSLGDYEQSLKRTHRPGQTRPVVYIHLVAKDTIDEEVYESLDKKRDIVQHVLDNIQPKQ